MRKLFQYWVSVYVIVCVCISCTKMDNPYKKFVVPGGVVYPEGAKSPIAYGGRNRVKISWLKGSDPSVVKAIVFWNNYEDSVLVDIPSANDTINVIIDHLAEGSYHFMIKTYDAKGNTSVPVEVRGTAEGDLYQAGLLSRPINKAIRDAQGNVTIDWGGANISGGAFTTEIQYLDTLGKERSLHIPAIDAVTVVKNMQRGTPIQYRTLYLPDALAIDTFYTDFETYHASSNLDKSKWTITTDSYEKTGQLPNGPPEKAIDNNPGTYWHTDYTVAPAPGYPHWLAIDLKDTITLTEVEFTSSENNLAADFSQFQIQGSMDGITWTNYGSFTVPSIAGLQDYYTSDSSVLRYVRIYITNGPHFYTHLADLSIYGY